MTEEEKKAIEYLENSLKSTVTHKEQLNIIKNLIQKQQAELDKKNKIIDEMASINKKLGFRRVGIMEFLVEVIGNIHENKELLEDK